MAVTASKDSKPLRATTAALFDPNNCQHLDPAVPELIGASIGEAQKRLPSILGSKAPVLTPDEAYEALEEEMAYVKHPLKSYN